MEVRRLPESELSHHGIKGQKWGVENGPPYPLGSNISTGKKLKKDSNHTNSINTKYIKRAAIAIGVAAGVGLAAYAGYRLHSKYAPYLFDKALKNKNIYTLSIKDTLEDVQDSRFFASFKSSDNNLYKRKYANSLLNKAKAEVGLGEETPNNVFQVVNKTKNMKIASIKNTENLFVNAYNNDVDFKNNVDKWFKSSEFTSRIGGNEWRISELYNAAEKGDLKSKYELFNRFGYVNKGNEFADNVQKTFKKVLSDNGYSAIYDLNDIRGSYSAKSPIIVTNSDSIIKQTANKIYDTDIQIAKKRYVNNTNAETLYKYISAGLLGTSAATYGTTKVIENKDK